MAQVHLSGSDQRHLRALLMAEPVPGRPVPGPDVLEHLHGLVPCDGLGVSYTDLDGFTAGITHLAPRGHGQGTVTTDPSALGDPTKHDGPFYLGVMHWRLHPRAAEGCDVVLGPRDDSLAIGFRNGGDHIVQFYFERKGRFFTDSERALLDLLGPVLQRLARERPTPALPPALTVTERRVLCEVSAGWSNAEIAEDMNIARATVRKHLENSYRKLGVTNRMAAVARLRGSDEPGLDLRERIERFA